jgi:hypothetical protein
MSYGLALLTTAVGYARLTKTTDGLYKLPNQRSVGKEEGEEC